MPLQSWLLQKATAFLLTKKRLERLRNYLLMAGAGALEGSEILNVCTCDSVWLVWRWKESGGWKPKRIDGLARKIGMETCSCKKYGL